MEAEKGGKQVSRVVTESGCLGPPPWPGERAEATAGTPMFECNTSSPLTFSLESKPARGLPRAVAARLNSKAPSMSSTSSTTMSCIPPGPISPSSLFLGSLLSRMTMSMYLPLRREVSKGKVRGQGWQTDAFAL